MGTVFLAISDADQTYAIKLDLHGDRERVRWMSTQHALIELRKRLV